MPTSLLTIPDLIQPVYNPIYTKVSSDKTSEEAFNFIFDLYINGNFINRDRLLPIPATNQAIYSPARILESYVSYDLSQSIVGSTASTKCIDYYEVITGEEYINPWRFDDFTAIGSGSTLSGHTVFYTTGTTANPYVSGDTVYVVQDSGYTSNYYNGVFSVISASSTSVIVDALYSISTPVTAGLMYYSDRRKTIYTGSTQILYNGAVITSAGGWSTYGPDGCGNTVAPYADLLAFYFNDTVVPCTNELQICNTGTTLIPGSHYQVTFNVNSVYNPSSGAQSITPILGGTAGTPFVGTGTSVQTIICGTGTTFCFNGYMNANTTGFGPHSMAIDEVEVYNVNGFSGYSWNAVYQYEEVPTYTYHRWNMDPNSSGSRFLSNRPSSVKTSLDDRGSIGFMTVLTANTANYYMIVTTTRYDGSGTTPSYFLIPEISTGGTLSTNSIICEFGCYPWNLNQLSTDTITSDHSSYRIQMGVESDPIGNPGIISPFSEGRIFDLDVPCSKFDRITFSWVNKLGQFDQFSATLKSTETVNITRNVFQKSLSYNYQVGDRGKTVISLDAQQTYSVVSDWINQSTSSWLTELFISQEVYIINSDGSLTPIIIDNNSIEIFNSVNKKLFNYTFNYTKAVPKNTQRN